MTAGAKAEAAPPKPVQKSGADRKEQKRLEAQQRQARSGARKAQQQLVQKLEKEIQTLEQKQAELTAELEKQETYDQPGRAAQINRELVEVQDQLNQLNPEWEKQAARLAEADVV